MGWIDRIILSIQSRWYARLRQIDLEILWPLCLAEADDLDQARAVFAAHALNDEAWMFLGEEAVCLFIDNLE